MPEEGSFLRAILTNPSDHLLGLVYADWLDEQQTDEAESKAKFLRLTVALRVETNAAKRLTMEEQLRAVARYLPTDWLPVVSRLSVENCAATGNTIRRPLEQVEFEFECPVLWESMAPTGDVTVRDCDSCKQKVYYCSTLSEAHDHAHRGHCIAVDVALPVGALEILTRRRTGLRGKPSKDWMERFEAERRTLEQAERISAEREHAKRQS